MVVLEFVRHFDESILWPKYVSSGHLTLHGWCERSHSKCTVIYDALRVIHVVHWVWWSTWHALDWNLHVACCLGKWRVTIDNTVANVRKMHRHATIMSDSRHWWCLQEKAMVERGGNVIKQPRKSPCTRAWLHSSLWRPMMATMKASQWRMLLLTMANARWMVMCWHIHHRKTILGQPLCSTLRTMGRRRSRRSCEFG